MTASDVEYWAAVVAILLFLLTVVGAAIKFLWPDFQFFKSPLYQGLRKLTPYLLLALVFYAIGYFVAVGARQNSPESDTQPLIQTVEVTRIVDITDSPNRTAVIEVTREVPIEVTRLVEAPPVVVTSPPIVVTATSVPMPESISVDVEQSSGIIGQRLRLSRVDRDGSSWLWRFEFVNESDRDMCITPNPQSFVREANGTRIFFASRILEADSRLSGQWIPSRGVRPILVEFTDETGANPIDAGIDRLIVGFINSPCGIESQFPSFEVALVK